MANVLRKKSRSEAPRYTESEVVPLNPVEASPQTAGDMLRAKREELGLDLREAAEYLRIRYAYLLALEEGRVDDLPGAAYALGFVRAYADYLGLDGAAVVERYKDETAVMDGDVRLVFPSPLPEGKIPGAAILLISVVALILVYVGWVVFAQQNVRIAELVPALPERFAALLGSDESASKPLPTTPAPADVSQPVATPAPETTAPPDTTTPVSPIAEAGVESAESVPAEGTPTAAAAVTEEPAPVDLPRDEPAPSVSVPAAEPRSETTPTPETPDPPVSAAVVPAMDAPAEPQTQPVVPSPSPLPTAPQAVSPDTPSTSEPDSPSTPEAARAAEGAATEAAVPVQQETPAPPADASASQDETPAVTAETTVDAAPLPPKAPALASAGPREYGAENVDARVTIKARIDSWVEIRDPTGDKLLTRVLRAGDSYRVPDKPGLLMETGNAGGLEISVDGQVIPDIGPRGAVRRNIALDADSLRATYR